MRWIAVRWPHSSTGRSADSNTVCRVRVCFITTTSFDRDPRALAEANATRAAGHEVVGVSTQGSSLDWVTSPGRVSWLGRLMARTTVQRVVSAAAGTRADLYVPVQPASIPMAAEAAAKRVGASYLNRPAWDSSDRESMVWRAPADPDLSLPALGKSPLFHVPHGAKAVPIVQGPVALVYRTSERTPGRYLEAAFRRTGVETTHLETLDWSLVPAGTAAVVIVESPLPAIAVHGANPGVPVVFWVHHGEHHLDVNVRLQRRYGASVVALAHSWHLSYRFHGLVERLPFGVAPEITDAEFRPHGDRSFDVAFVGSRSAGSRYHRREQLLTGAKARFGDDRVIVADDIAPEQMMAFYRDSRIVPDDGVGRHLPITMRFFEATGAGALLLTRETPGMRLLLDPADDYVVMEDDGLSQLGDLLAGATEPVALSGHAAVWDRHTYDTRVAELFAIIDRARTLDVPPPPPPEKKVGISAAVAAFADTQRVLDLEAGVEGELPDREVWAFSDAIERAEPATFHMAVIGGGSAEDRLRAVRAARLAVVAPSGLADEIEKLVRSVHGGHRRFRFPGATAFTFGTSGYRVSSAPDPD
jgi:hypothetical protein